MRASTNSIAIFVDDEAATPYRESVIVTKADNPTKYPITIHLGESAVYLSLASAREIAEMLTKAVADVKP